MLEFVGDAICLSGLTGTRLKSEVIGKYYPFWWSITSGGKNENYRYSTAIVELNAATGEVHIKDTGETILGSAGHLLELKVRSPNTSNFKVVLIEDNLDCYAHLKKVVRRRWPNVSIEEAEVTRVRVYQKGKNRTKSSIFTRCGDISRNSPPLFSTSLIRYISNFH